MTKTKTVRKVSELSMKRGEIGRRDFLIKGGAGVATTALGITSGLFSSTLSSNAQVPIAQVPILGSKPIVGITATQVGNTMVLPQTHFLSTALAESAKGFPIGNSTIKLDLSSKSSVVGAVNEYTLTGDAAKRLQAKTLILDSAITALEPGTSGMKTVQNTFKQYKMPATVADTANFALLTVRRRDLVEADRLNVLKSDPVKQTSTVLVGLAANEKKTGVNVYFLFPAFKSKKTGKLIRPAIFKKFVRAQNASGGASVTPDEPVEATNPPEQTEEEFDFAQCFLGCAAATAIPFGTLAGGLGTACVTAVAALPPTGGLSAFLGVPACAGALLCLLAPFLICLGVCGIAGALED